MSVWSLVLVLLVIAFWRTIAPERSASVIKTLVASQHSKDVQSDVESRAVKELEELVRERRAVARERMRLESIREQLSKMNQSDSVYQQFANDGALTPIGTALQNTHSSSAGRFGEDEGEVQENLEEEENVEEVEEIEEDDEAEGCELVWAPVAAETGLGTQTEHLWAHLTIARALNACVALPPVVARTSAATRYIPADEVLNLEALSDLGLRIVSLKSCSAGVSALFGDALRGKAAIRRFEHYVTSADPALAISSSITKGKIELHNFLKSDDPLAQAEHIRTKAVLNGEQRCIGAGRVNTLTPDDNVIRSFRASNRIKFYVDDRFSSDISTTLFVRLRWKIDACRGTPPEHACLGDGGFVHLKEYVGAIKEEAKRVGASQIYLSFPIDTPEEVMRFFDDTIEAMDAIILRLEGDEFAANVVERELALRARAFVHDGGVWGSTIQQARKISYPQYFEESASITHVLSRWKSAGQPPHDDLYVPNMVLEKASMRAEKESKNENIEYEIPPSLENSEAQDENTSDERGDVNATEEQPEAPENQEASNEGDAPTEGEVENENPGEEQPEAPENQEAFTEDNSGDDGNNPNSDENPQEGEIVEEISEAETNEQQESADTPTDESWTGEEADVNENVSESNEGQGEEATDSNDPQALTEEVPAS